tara:strand:- start:77 stop:505 length:429 start_codon:yes stop_codon:yes gene_type:complete
MNSCAFVGRLVKEVVIRESKSGAKVLFNRLAVRAPRKDEEDLFINFVVFGKAAEVVAEYRQKGGELGISGRLRPGRPWVDAKGNERQETEIVVNDVSLVGAVHGATVAQPDKIGNPPWTPSAPQHPQDKPIINPFDDDDIPY